MYKELFVVLCVVSVMTAHPANKVKDSKVSKNVEIKDNDLESAESSYGNLNFGRAFGSFGGLGHGLGLGSFGGLGSGIFSGGFGGFGRIFGGHGFFG